MTASDEPPEPVSLFLGFGSGDDPKATELAWPGQSESRRHDPTMAGSARPLPGFTTSLFVQGFTEAAADLAQLVNHTGVGVVLTFDRRSHNSKTTPLARARDAVARIRDFCPGADLLIDWNGYSGGNLPSRGLHGHTTKRKTAADGLSPSWIDDQHRVLKLPWALTDSGYCADLDDVAAVLAAAADLAGQVVTLLPIPHELLRDHADDLVALVDQHPHPVAVVLEHQADPFNEPGVARAAVQLIRRASPPVLFLRSDTSALGVIAHGAAVGAVGTTSGLRHLYPAADPFSVTPQVSFVVPGLLRYTTNPHFLTAYTVDPSLLAWRCPCWFCNSRALAWIDAEPDRKRQGRAAFQHSVAAIAGIADRLAIDAATVGAVSAWENLCGHAQAEHCAVIDNKGKDWVPPRSLSLWRAVPTVVSRQAPFRP